MSFSGDGTGVGARPFSSRSSRSASRFGRQERQKTNDQFREEMQQQTTEDLNVRVRERDPIGVPEDRPRSRLGSFIFKSSGGGGESSSMPSGSAAGAIEQKATELKETLTRPLSSLFRRSTSHHDRSAQQQQAGHQSLQPPAVTAAATTSSAALPPVPARSVPTARGPLTTGGQQATGNAAAATPSPATRGSNSMSSAGGMANGMPPTLGAGGSLTTTATRPFSGFPGKRPMAASVQAEPPQQANVDNPAQFETDLSEQAAIAPQVNVRRFSGLATDSSALFLSQIGQQQPHQQSSRTAKGSANKAGDAQIDVNFLSRFLCPEDEIQDEQTPWTWDSLFTSVTSELREEWALEEEANNNNDAVAEQAAGMPIPNGPLQHQQHYMQQKGF